MRLLREADGFADWPLACLAKAGMEGVPVLVDCHGRDAEVSRSSVDVRRVGSFMVHSIWCGIS